MALKVSLVLTNLHLIPTLNIPADAPPDLVSSLHDFYEEQIRTAPENYPEAYAKIDFIRVFRSETLICVSWYATESARWEEQPPVHVMEFSASTSELGGSIYPAAYEYLKTLLEFAGAIDC